MYFQKNYRLLTYGPEMINILSKPIEENEWHEIPSLFEYMLDVMNKSYGIGLAAPQIGCFKQMVLVKRQDESVIGIVNPEVTRLYGKEIDGIEGCLSLPPSGNECLVPRLEIIDIEASLSTSPHIRKKFTFRGAIARIVQHEIDHLYGTFFIDRVSDRKRKEVLDRFKNWKAMRKAQIRRVEENRNVDTGLVAAGRGQSRVS